jgi:hypothetical protein
MNTANGKQGAVNGGLMLVKRPAVRVNAEALREATTGSVVMLPRVWAVAEGGAAAAAPNVQVANVQAPDAHVAKAPASRPKVQLAFYRKYTEALLRRYARMSLGGGRTQSLMGRELFRGNVSHCNVTGFDDGVIFCHDVEACLKTLNAGDRAMLRRVAMQEYSWDEAATLLGLGRRTLARFYSRAVDRLTQKLLERKILEPLKSCQ